MFLNLGLYKIFCASFFSLPIKFLRYFLWHPLAHERCHFYPGCDIAFKKNLVVMLMIIFVLAIGSILKVRRNLNSISYI